MVIQLQPNDRRQLIELLINVPELETARGCKQLLKDASLEQFVSRIDFSGSSRIIVGDIINILCKHGRISSNETTLSRFLDAVKDYIDDDQQAFLDKLLEKYQMLTPSTPLHDISVVKDIEQQKILILTAIPHNLRLDKEIREIENAIRRSGKRESFEIRTRTAVRPQDIRRAIAEETPQIVHFCGHGMEDGSLLLEDDGGLEKPVSPQGLASLFELHADYVKCVLLNACYSVKPAEAISQHINYVIGMNQPIDDKAAIAFSQGFYDGLGYTNINNQDAIKRAFKEGMVAIKMENISQGAIPVLKTYSIENQYSQQPEELQKGDIIESYQSSQQRQKFNSSENNQFLKQYNNNYTRLESLLIKKRWKEADKETLKIMLELAKRTDQPLLTEEDIIRLSHESVEQQLKDINYLWSKYSNEQFSFNIQKQIYLRTEKDFNEFSNKVGWRKKPGIFGGLFNWKSYEELDFELTAPKGHLPYLVYRDTVASSTGSRLGTLSDKLLLLCLKNINF